MKTHKDFLNHREATYSLLKAKYALLFLENKHNENFIRVCDENKITEKVRDSIEDMSFDMDLMTSSKIEAITGCKFWQVSKNE